MEKQNRLELSDFNICDPCHINRANDLGIYKIIINKKDDTR